MEQVPVTVEERPETLKPEAKSLRRQGLIPAVVYHKGDSTVAVTLGESDLHRVLHSEAGRNALITLTIKDKKGDKTRTVVVKDIQFHPISGKALNVDFHQISLTEKIKVLVQVIERAILPLGGNVEQAHGLARFRALACFAHMGSQGALPAG